MPHPQPGGVVVKDPGDVGVILLNVVGRVEGKAKRVAEAPEFKVETTGGVGVASAWIVGLFSNTPGNPPGLSGRPPINPITWARPDRAASRAERITGWLLSGA